MESELYKAIEIEESKISDNFAKNIEFILRRKGIGQRDRNFFKQLYGLGCEGKTKQEIADENGLSYTRINQIHTKALRKLKIYFIENSDKKEFLCYK